MPLAAACIQLQRQDMLPEASCRSLAFWFFWETRIQSFHWLKAGSAACLFTSASAACLCAAARLAMMMRLECRLAFLRRPPQRQSKFHSLAQWLTTRLAARPATAPACGLLVGAMWVQGCMALALSQSPSGAHCGSVGVKGRLKSARAAGNEDACALLDLDQDRSAHAAAAALRIHMAAKSSYACWGCCQWHSCAGLRCLQLEHAPMARASPCPCILQQQPLGQCCACMRRPATGGHEGGHSPCRAVALHANSSAWCHKHSSAGLQCLYLALPGPARAVCWWAWQCARLAPHMCSRQVFPMLPNAAAGHAAEG